MNLQLTGQHVEITPSIRNYVMSKLERINRHFDHVIDVNVVLSVDKLQHKVEVNLHTRGKDIHVEAIEADMYAAVDMLIDKLDRQVVKHKEKLTGQRHEGPGIKHDASDADAPLAPTGATRAANG